MFMESGDSDYIDQYVSFLKPRYHYVKFYELFELIGLQFTFLRFIIPGRNPAGVIIRQEDTKIVITGDTSPEIPEKSLELIKTLILLIADAIVPPHIHIKKHMNSEEAMALAQKLNAKKVARPTSATVPPASYRINVFASGVYGQVFEF
jgi:phosphoribosyl 1,2-cyclic phosphate phosphodiesterase